MVHKEKQLDYFFLELKNVGDPNVFKLKLGTMKQEFLERIRKTVLDGNCDVIPEVMRRIWLRISANYALLLAWQIYVS